MRGRNFKGSTIVNGRQYATDVVGTTIWFECERAKHRYKIDYSKKPLARRMGVSACAMMARWWSREKGGCIGACPSCERSGKRLAKTNRGRI